MKVRILAASLLFLSNSILPGWWSGAVMQHSKTNHTPSSKSTVLAAGTLAAYALHRGCQYFAHKAIYNQPKKDVCGDKKHTNHDAPYLIGGLHGLGGNNFSQSHYLERHGGFNKDIAIQSVDFPSSTITCKAGHLGQEGNIEQVIDLYKKVSDKGYNVILHGVSDGAASGVTTLGTYNLKNVKAAIVESPYADVKQAIRRVLRKFYLDWIPGIGSFGALMASMIHCGYSTYGVRPIDVVHKIQKDIPVLFVCVKDDIITPEQGTVELYNNLKKAGHNKAHLLLLEHGDHGFLLEGPDGDIYRATMHAFLRHYELPHDATWADQCTHKDFITRK